MNNCRTNVTSIEMAVHKGKRNANLRGDHENRKGVTPPVFCFFIALLCEMGVLISSNTQSPYIFCWREYLMCCSFPDHFISISCFEICLIN
jgi:hypothetical protein